MIKPLLGVAFNVYDSLLRNGDIGCHLGKFVSIIYWCEACDFSKNIPKGLCIGIAYIKHHLGHVFS